MPIALIRGMNMKPKSKTVHPKAHITVIENKSSPCQRDKNAENDMKIIFKKKLKMKEFDSNWENFKYISGGRTILVIRIKKTIFLLYNAKQKPHFKNALCVNAL